MKLIDALKISFLTLAAAVFVTACTTDEKQSDQLLATNPVAKSINPFPFYKAIEIKPGFNF